MIYLSYIVNHNALNLDWHSVSAGYAGHAPLYLLGNPPFRGSKFQSDSQKQELATLFGAIPNAKQLDYVALRRITAQ